MFYKRTVSINGIEMSPGSDVSYLILKDYIRNKVPLRILTLVDSVWSFSKINLKEQLIVKIDAYEHDDAAETAPRLVSSEEFVGVPDSKKLVFTNEELEYIKSDEHEHLLKERMVDKTAIRLALFETHRMGGLMGGVYKDFDLTSLIAIAFKECFGEGYALYLSEPDNTGVVSEPTLFEPMGFKQFLQYLDSAYAGIYGTGYNIYTEGKVCHVLSEADAGEDDILDVVAIPVTSVNARNSDTDIIVIAESSIKVDDRSPYLSPEAVLYGESVKVQDDGIGGFSLATLSESGNTFYKKQPKKENIMIDMVGSDILEKVKPYTKVKLNRDGGIELYNIDTFSTLYIGYDVTVTLKLYRFIP